MLGRRAREIPVAGCVVVDDARCKRRLAASLSPKHSGFRNVSAPPAASLNLAAGHIEQHGEHHVANVGARKGGYVPFARTTSAIFIFLKKPTFFPFLRHILPVLTSFFGKSLECKPEGEGKPCPTRRRKPPRRSVREATFRKARRRRPRLEVLCS